MESKELKDMEFIEIIQCIVVWMIKLARYLCIHVVFANIMDVFVFKPVMQWVEDNMFGAEIEGGDIGGIIGGEGGD